MFASLNLLTPTLTPSMDAGGDTRAEGDSDFMAYLETQVSFSELAEMPEPIAVSADLGSGDLLPVDGKNLPVTAVLAHLPAQREPLDVGIVAPSDELQLTDIEVDLNVEYPLADQQADAPPLVSWLPQGGSELPKPVLATPVPGESAETSPANEKPLPPVELLRPVRPTRAENPEWIAAKAETGPAIANAINATHYKSTQVAVEGTTAAIPVADGDTALQDIPVVAPPVRAASTLDTVRQADTRVPGAKAPVAATPTHIAATLSQFSANTALTRDDTLSALIGTPVRDNAWGEKLGERVMMLAGNQIKTADIRLTPADLGPLRVQLSIDDGTANVTFHAQHAVTREAIEQALPRLREMLAESGLSLGQASVSDRGTSEGDARNGRANPTANSLSGGDSSESLTDSDIPVRRKSVSIDGLIDTFA